MHRVVTAIKSDSLQALLDECDFTRSPAHQAEPPPADVGSLPQWTGPTIEVNRHMPRQRKGV